MAKLVSKRAYARSRGVTDTAVRKAEKAGRITKRADGKIDPARADREWARNTDPTKPLNSETGNPKHRKSSPDAPSEPMALDGSRGGREKDPVAGFSKARTRREILRALREELAYRRDVEGWVPVDQVRAAAAAAGEIACNRIKLQASRLAKVLASVAGSKDVPRFRKILADDANKTCAELMEALQRAARGER